MASPTGPTNVGIAPNVGGLLCYAPLCCLNIVFAIVVIAIEKQSRFLRFHAFQSLLFMVALTIVFVILNILVGILSTISGMLGLAGTALMGLLSLGALVADVFLMMKAYNGEEYELPVIGPMAKGWA